MEALERKYPRSVNALLRRSRRNEAARARKEAFLRRGKQEREALLAENERLRRENVSALRQLVLLTGRFEKLRDYTERLRNWLAVRTGRGKPSGEENEA